MNIKLSSGDLVNLFKLRSRYENASGGIYQCAQTKKNEQITSNKKNLILINDGVYHVKALLRGIAVEKALSLGLKRGDIFRTISVEPAIVKEKKKYVLLIDDFEMLQSDADMRNSSTEFVDAYFASHPSEILNLDDPIQQNSPPSIPLQKQNQQSYYAMQQTELTQNKNHIVEHDTQKSRPIFAIEQLSPYQNMWTIKARVSFKSDIKTWSNQRGEGKLFNVNLLDTSGEIRATAFNDNAIKFNDILQEGKVYYVSKARIQPSKPQFSNLKHPYELQLDRDTVVEECFDVTDVPKMNFNFIKLNNMDTQEPNSNVDVLGVIQIVNPHFELVSKSGKKFDRRDITIVDDSGFSISLGLWGEQALNFNLSEGSIIAIKGARVSDFNGKSLTMGFNSTLHANPEIPEAYAVKGWYDAKGSETQFQSLKSEFNGDQNTGKFIASRITIAKAIEENLGRSEKGDFFSVKAAISFLKVDNFAYPACSSEGCQKKVLEQSDGTWRCEKCEINHPSPKWRYMLTISIMDETQQIWLTLFNDQAEQLLGVDANTLVSLKEKDVNEFQRVTQNIQMDQYDFRIRAREDNYNDESRIRYTVSNIYNLKWRSEADYLAQELSKVFLS